MPRNAYDLNAICPIRREPSAHMMLTNALYLLQAGSIESKDAAAVFRRASEIIYRQEMRNEQRSLMV
jgi:hypothetical protein